MTETLTNLGNLIIVMGIKILYAAIIFFIGKWLAHKVSDVSEKAMLKTKLDVSLARFTKKLIYFGLLAFVTIAALGKLGIQTASFVALVGAAGLAIGLALQGSLANFAAGVLILIFKPFTIGDVIEVGGAKGNVQEISIFTTTINSADNVKTIIPNAQITSGNITNFTANETRRVDLIASISYSDDIAKAKDVLKNLLAAEPRILKDPEYTVAVSALGDSSVNLVVRPWVKKEDYWDIYFGITEKIKLEFDKNDISIPFPQRDLHIVSKTESVNI